VTFVGPTSLDVHWEIESIDSTGIAVYRFENGRVELQERLQIREANPSGIDPVTPMADDMADNEVHHLTMFRAEASGWIVGATSVQDKVRRVFDRVQQLYRYDATIQHIAEFTWADNLVRDINGRRGICDEWAVVEISYLRSIGIPARLKFLVWRENGNDEAHAALEYSDGGTWRQLDALWNAFNDPGIYRRNGATSVTVMDADDPLDSRSTTPAWGVPDPTGDGKLYPYGDFVLRPDYPGNARPGYSY
jgi:transglutaminase-like putative cysteine protease